VRICYAGWPQLTAGNDLWNDHAVTVTVLYFYWAPTSRPRACWRRRHANINKTLSVRGVLTFDPLINDNNGLLLRTRSLSTYRAVQKTRPVIKHAALNTQTHRYHSHLSAEPLVSWSLTSLFSTNMAISAKPDWSINLLHLFQTCAFSWHTPKAFHILFNISWSPDIPARCHIPSTSIAIQRLTQSSCLSQPFFSCQLTELRFYVPLDTKEVISETFFLGNLLV